MSTYLIIGLVLAVIGAIFWAYRKGASGATAVAGRAKAEAEAKAAVERLAMRAEGDKIDDANAALSDAEAIKKAVARAKR